MDPVLQDVIDVMTGSREWTPDNVVFRCDTISRILVERCRRAGIDARIARLGPHRGPLPRMHEKWHAITGGDANGKCAGHHVVIAGFSGKSG